METGPATAVVVNIPTTIQEDQESPSQQQQLPAAEVPTKPSCDSEADDPGSDWVKDITLLSLPQEKDVPIMIGDSSGDDSLPDTSDIIKGKALPKQGKKKTIGGNVAPMPSGTSYFLSCIH